MIHTAAVNAFDKEMRQGIETFSSAPEFFLTTKSQPTKSIEETWNPKAKPCPAFPYGIPRFWPDWQR